MKRRPHSIELCMESPDQTLYLKVSERFGSHFRKLNLNSGKIESPSQFLEILHHMHFLEQLELHSMDWVSFRKNTDLTKSHPVALGNLRSIVMTNLDVVILSFLNGSNIVELEILESDSAINQLQLQYLEEFLITAKSLKTLKTDYNCFQRLFSIADEINFPFNLTKLSVDFAHAEILKEHDSRILACFLKPHAESMKVLILKRMLPLYSQEVLEFVFKEYKNLEKLEIENSCLPVEDAFYEQLFLFPSKSIKYLAVTKRICNEELLARLVSNLPNLSGLKVYEFPLPQISLTISSNSPVTKCSTGILRSCLCNEYVEFLISMILLVFFITIFFIFVKKGLNMYKISKRGA